MQSQVSEISAVIVEVDVEVPWDDVKKELDGTYKRLGQTARVRGFRPGKVPRHVLKQLYGKRVRADVAQQVVELGLTKAVEEHEIDVVSVNPMDDTPNIEEGQALAFKAKLEVRPKIETVDYAGIELTRPASGVDDEAVAKELDRLRNENAELAEPDPMRPARETDVLTCDYTVAVDGEERADMNATDRAIEISEGLLPEFREALLGKQPEQTFTFEMTFPEDHGPLAGKTGEFSLTVNGLKEKLLPELDDEFAKDLGDHETLDALKASLREGLEKDAASRTDSALRQELLDQLQTKNPIEVPPTLIDRQHRAMLQEYLQIVQMTGQVPGEDALENLKEAAEKKVRTALLLGAVAREKELKASPEEIDAKLAEMAERTGKHVAKVRAEMQGEQQQMLESRIVEEKLLEYLLGQATITDAAT